MGDASKGRSSEPCSGSYRASAVGVLSEIHKGVGLRQSAKQLPNVSKGPTKMSRITLLVLLLFSTGLAGVGTAHGQSAPDTTQVENPELRRTLLAMKERDQQIRQALVEKQQSGAQLTFEDVARIDSVDQIHTARMKTLVDAHGWPGTDLVGPEGANAAFLLVQHADHDLAFQKRCLTLLREAFANEQAPGRQVALLTDRVRVAEGQPQLYGTQAQLQNGEIVFQPIEDSLQVNARRAEMGLMPIEEYEQRMREMYLQQSGGAPEK